MTAKEKLAEGRASIEKYVLGDVAEKSGRDLKSEVKPAVLEFLAAAGKQRVLIPDGSAFHVELGQATQTDFVQMGVAKDVLKPAQLLEICDISSSKLAAAVSIGRITQQDADLLVASKKTVPRIYVRPAK